MKIKIDVKRRTLYVSSATAFGVSKYKVLRIKDIPNLDQADAIEVWHEGERISVFHPPLLKGRDWFAWLDSVISGVNK